MNNSKRNLILVGFMGTGKSTVSNLLSERLSWKSKDMDVEIEQTAQRTIKEMFAEDGEEYFRNLESRVLAELLLQDNLVIATGGGAVLRESNRELMLHRGWVVALTADKASLIERMTNTAAAGTRPLLAGDAEERIHTLLESRRHAYDFADVKIDTTGRSPTEVAELIMQWLPPATN